MLNCQRKITNYGGTQNTAEDSKKNFSKNNGKDFAELLQKYTNVNKGKWHFKNTSFQGAI